MTLETYRRAVQQFTPGASRAASRAVISTHRGRTLEEARKVARLELGSDFTVVATRRIPRDGVLGFFGAEEFELSATKNPESIPEESRAPFPATNRVEPRPHSEIDLNAIRNEVRSEVRSLRTLITQRVEAPDDSSARRTLETELSELRHTLAELESDRDTPTLMKRRLASAGIEGHAARAIFNHMKHLGQKGSENDLANAIATLVSTIDWPLDGDGRTLIALVGPTGVGKTTTAAKLAAHGILHQNRSVTLVSCDGFRVGATAQMERYAELLGAELEVARTASELESIVAQSRTDITIVDTGGRGPAEKNSVEAAIARLKLTDERRGMTQHTLLCAPACVRDADARRMQKFFSACKPTGLVITKIDETEAPAGLVHVALASELPIAALCFGQRVPEDIATASPEAIQAVMFGDKPGRKSRDRS